MRSLNKIVEQPFIWLDRFLTNQKTYSFSYTSRLSSTAHIYFLHYTENTI